jgi:hypothetical protein
MVDLVNRAKDPLVVAQAKEPVLPDRPAPPQRDENQPREALLKSRAEELLGAGDKIEIADRELLSLLSSGGQNKESAEKSMRSLLKSLDAASAILQLGETPPRFKIAADRMVAGTELLTQKWDEYRPGVAFPVWNPRKWSDSWHHFQDIKLLQGYLSIMKEQLEKMKPFLLKWANPPQTPPSDPDSDRPALA